MKRHGFFGLVLFVNLLWLGAVEAKELELRAADKVKVFGEFSAAKGKNDKLVLLFHQARSNHHEYDTIAPALNKVGFDTLAIDQRSGGKLWGHDNKTVKTLGKSTSYMAALADMQAALDWAVAKKYKQIVTVGSSYSAALNFVLASKNKDKLAAMVSFSPGEYFGQQLSVAEAAKTLTLPIYVSSGASKREQSMAATCVSKIKGKNVTLRKPKVGVHGASTLRKDRNAGGYAENMKQFLSFLKGLKSP